MNLKRLMKVSDDVDEYGIDPQWDQPVYTLGEINYCECKLRMLYSPKADTYYATVIREGGGVIATAEGTNVNNAVNEVLTQWAYVDKRNKVQEAVYNLERFLFNYVKYNRTKL